LQIADQAGKLCRPAQCRHCATVRLTTDSCAAKRSNQLWIFYVLLFIFELGTGTEQTDRQTDRRTTCAVRPIRTTAEDVLVIGT